MSWGTWEIDNTWYLWDSSLLNSKYWMKSVSICYFQRVNMWCASILWMDPPTLTAWLLSEPSLLFIKRYVLSSCNGIATSISSDTWYLLQRPDQLIPEYLSSFFSIIFSHSALSQVHRWGAMWEGCPAAWQKHSGCWICAVWQCHHDSAVNRPRCQLLHAGSSA